MTLDTLTESCVGPALWRFSILCKFVRSAVYLAIPGRIGYTKVRCIKRGWPQVQILIKMHETVTGCRKVFVTPEEMQPPEGSLLSSLSKLGYVSSSLFYRVVQTVQHAARMLSWANLFIYFIIIKSLLIIAFVVKHIITNCTVSCSKN